MAYTIRKREEQDLAHKVFADHRSSVGLVDPFELQRAILGALLSHNLPETAQVLREEGIVGNAEPSGDGILGPLLQPGAMHPDAAATLTRSQKAPSSLLSHQHSIVAVASKTEGHHKRVGALSARIKAMREEAQEWLPDDGAEQVTEETNLATRRQIEDSKARASKIRATTSEYSQTEADLERRLQEVQTEIDRLRAEVKSRELQQSSPSPTKQVSAEDQLIDQLSQLLARWNDASGPRMAAAYLFAQADRNHDGKLDWNSHEIKNFVADVFIHYKLQPPAWPDSFWYGLYRTCDTDFSYSLDIEEAFHFAQYCFDIALKSLQSHHMHVACASSADVASTLQRALDEWHGPSDLRRVAFECFVHADRNKDGHLDWNGEEVREFAHLLFQRYGAAAPKWPDSVWFELYRTADVDHANSLGVDQAFIFAKHCIELLLSEVRSG